MDLVDLIRHRQGTRRVHLLAATTLMFRFAAANAQAVDCSSFPNASKRDFGTLEVATQ